MDFLRRSQQDYRKLLLELQYAGFLFNLDLAVYV